ncbi:MAG: hypothetical protein Q7K39_03285 [Candidatus Magasanikbacteria bacterium]|nr:hypothetical protein [Candidatus Magasanikbacteria bacterium]
MVINLALKIKLWYNLRVTNICAALQRTLRGMISSNHMYKKIKVLSTVFITFLVTWPMTALAQYGLNEAAGKMGFDRSKNVYGVISLVVGAALAFTGLVFFGMMMYAGVRWMTARGNEDLAEKAKQALANSTIGFVIVALSYALTRFVFGALNLPTF